MSSSNNNNKGLAFLFTILTISLFLLAVAVVAYSFVENKDSPTQENSERDKSKKSEEIVVKPGEEKYVLTLEIRQTRKLPNLEEMLKDSMNAIEIEIPVDKDYFDSLRKGDKITDSFRVGSLLLKGSLGNWSIEVIDKRIAMAD